MNEVTVKPAIYDKGVCIMKKAIDVFDYAGVICKALYKGYLMTTKNGDFVNTMTIGWGSIGVEWGRPIFTAYVRESRFTREMVDQNGEFTVNIPVGPIDHKIISICGTKSGRNMDKIKELGLTLVESDNISVPGIKELPLTLECKVIYKQKQDLSNIPDEIIKKFYPNVANGSMIPDQDCHYAYYSEIVAAYIIED